MKRPESNLNNKELKDVTMLALEKKEKELSRTIKALKEAYTEQVRSIMRSVEEREKESLLEVKKLDQNIQELFSRMERAELDIELTNKKIQLITENTDSIVKDLDSMKKAFSREFELVEDRLFGIKSQIESQDESLEIINKAMINNTNSQNEVKKGQEKLYNIQNDFIENLWKALFILLTFITAAGTGIGAFISNVMN